MALVFNFDDSIVIQASQILSTLALSIKYRAKINRPIHIKIFLVIIIKNITFHFFLIKHNVIWHIQLKYLFTIDSKFVFFYCHFLNWWNYLILWIKCLALMLWLLLRRINNIILFFLFLLRQNKFLSLM